MAKVGKLLNSRNTLGALVTPGSIWRSLAVLLSAWTLVVAALLWIDHSSEQQGAREAATIAAKSQFDKDVLYRRWNARLGGVYAVVTDDVVPNPYLTQVTDRDIRTEAGTELTLINPAYMTRQVHELALETEGILGHITSLDPIRPENAPDPWERRALELFDEPGDLVTSIERTNGEEYLRFMQPLMTEMSCMVCHADQGYVVGEVRGGISVSVPMEEYHTIARANFGSAVIGYGVIWLIGSLGLVWGGNSLARRAGNEKRAREKVEELLLEKQLLLREVQHRIKNNMSMMSALLHLKAGSVTDEESRQGLEDTSLRFDAMMLLYDELYTGPDPDALSLRAYIPELVNRILRAVPTQSAITADTTVPDVLLPAKVLTNLGIFTAEILTNALKHAFPQGRPGSIRVSAVVSDSHLTYTVEDDGIGLPEEREIARGRGLGFTLITTLAEQLQGDLTISRRSGTTFRLVMPLRDGSSLPAYHGHQAPS